MDNTQQRIKIAEACYKGKGDLEIFMSASHIPDYLNNLNAMHKAEQSLKNEERGT